MQYKMSMFPGKQQFVNSWLTYAAGVYINSYDATLNAKNGFPVFSTQVEANWLSKSEDKYASFRLTDEDRDEINRLSKDPNIGESSLEKLMLSGTSCIVVWRLFTLHAQKAQNA